MPPCRRAIGALALSLAVAISLVRPSHAQSVAEFYAGKQITMIIGSAAGGGYDGWARLIARHMGKHIPGAPIVVPRNMPGAGTLVAANHVYTVAPKDGTVIGSIAREAALAPLTGAEARFDAFRFTWLGSPTDETSICIAHKRAGVRSFAELQERELIVGETGPGTGTHVFPRLLNAVLGAKLKTVPSYSGGPEVFLAMERNEVDGVCESLDTVVRRAPEQLKDGTFVVLLQRGAAPHPGLEAVPFVFDLAKTEEQKQALTFVYAAQGIGRPFIAPPDLPADRAQALREAFAATMTDPELIADGARQGLEPDPVTGERIVEILRQIYATPQPIVDKVGDILQLKKK